QRAHRHRKLGLADRVPPQGRADLGLEGLVQRGWQCPRAQNRHQIFGFLDQLLGRPEAAQRDADALAQARLDDGRRRDALVENDGHLAADVLGRQAFDDARALAVEDDVDLGPAGLLVPAYVGVGQVLAGQLGARLDALPLPPPLARLDLALPLLLLVCALVTLVFLGGAIARLDLLVADLIA